MNVLTQDDQFIFLPFLINFNLELTRGPWSRMLSNVQIDLDPWARIKCDIMVAVHLECLSGTVKLLNVAHNRHYDLWAETKFDSTIRTFTYT